MAKARLRNLLTGQSFHPWASNCTGPCAKVMARSGLQGAHKPRGTVYVLMAPELSAGVLRDECREAVSPSWFLQRTTVARLFPNLLFTAGLHREIIFPNALAPSGCEGLEAAMKNNIQVASSWIWVREPVLNTGGSTNAHRHGSASCWI